MHESRHPALEQFIECYNRHITADERPRRAPRAPRTYGDAGKLVTDDCIKP